MRHSLYAVLSFIAFFSGVSRAAAIQVEPSSLPAASQGKPYLHHLTVKGGKSPYSVRDLPPGLSFDRTSENDLIIFGKCTGPTSTGLIHVTDAGQTSFPVQFDCNPAAPTVPEENIEYKSFIGIQQSQASSANRTWKLVADLGLSVKIYRWARFVVDLDLASVPQQVSFNVSQVTTQGPALIKNLTLNQAVQSLNLLVGGEIGNVVPDRFSSVVAIKGLVLGGFSTPLSPLESVAIYNSTQEAFDALKINGTDLPSKYPYIAFTTPDRSRFYSQYYAGLRFKLLDPDFKGLDTNYPTYFDMSFGQNSAVTGGQLRRFVWRFAGFVPIPHTPIALVGNAYLAIKKNTSIAPLFLSIPATAITLPDPQVYVIPKVENRDFYQIGFVLDLVPLVNSALSRLKLGAP